MELGLQYTAACAFRFSPVCVYSIQNPLYSNLRPFPDFLSGALSRSPFVTVVRVTNSGHTTQTDFNATALQYTGTLTAPKLNCFKRELHARITHTHSGRMNK